MSGLPSNITSVLETTVVSASATTTALLVLVVLFAGAVGMARLRLGAHEPVDVYQGYAAGFAAVLVAQGLL